MNLIKQTDRSSSSFGDWDTITEVSTHIAEAESCEEFWYRYNVFLGLECEVIPVIKHTPKGVWLQYYDRRRFVLNKSTYRFACTTRELALDSFIARKKKHIRILSDKIIDIKKALSVAQDHKKKSSPK